MCSRRPESVFGVGEGSVCIIATLGGYDVALNFSFYSRHFQSLLALFLRASNDESSSRPPLELALGLSLLRFCRLFEISRSSDSSVQLKFSFYEKMFPIYVSVFDKKGARHYWRWFFRFSEEFQSNFVIELVSLLSIYVFVTID